VRFSTAMQTGSVFSRPDSEARLPSGSGRHCDLAAAVLSVSAQGRRLRHRQLLDFGLSLWSLSPLQGDQPLAMANLVSRQPVNVQAAHDAFLGASRMGARRFAEFARNFLITLPFGDEHEHLRSRRLLAKRIALGTMVNQLV